MNDMTLEQDFAITLIELGEPLPLDLLAKLAEQGVIIDEFIALHIY